MAESVKILRVVVASPTDVNAERDRVLSVVEDLNKGVAADRRLRLEVIRWETDSYPGFHLEGPQGLIDPILRIEDSDIVIGIFWKRFGTPSKEGTTGTEHEIRNSYGAWLKYKRPQVMVYFNQKSSTPQSQEEAAQWGEVLKFRKDFPEEGLWWPYNGTAQFERLLRTHLTNFIRDKYQLGMTDEGNGKENDLPIQSNDLIVQTLTGPLTIGAVLKGPERQFVNDAYPIGDSGVHFVFSIFNGSAFDFLVNRFDIDVLTYATLNLDHLMHGVGATAVRRYFRAMIRPECGSYAATYLGRRHGEFVTIPPGKSEAFDVEISTRTEGLYDVCLRVHGGSAGKGFNVPLNSTKRRIAFFDGEAGYMVDRGGGRMLTYEEYSLEMES